MNQNLNTMEGCRYKITLKFTGQEDLGDYSIYGSSCHLGCNNHHSDFEILEKNADSCIMVIPALKAGSHLYQLFLKRLSTNQEFLILDGRIEVKNRCGKDVSEAINSTSSEVEIIFNAEEIQVDVAIQEGSKGEKGERGEKGEQGEKGEPGATVEFDTTPKSGSTNAVTSGGLFNLLKETGIAIGRDTVTPSFYGISIGSESSTKGWGAISMGKDAKVNGAGSISIGANVLANNSIGLGRLLTVKDAGVVAMATPNLTNPQTILYLIGASTSLANTYENGEACLGYVVKDSSGNILACGTRKLSELLTNNTAFAPAALDLDAPAPTPFLPTGITDPIEIKEELTD